MGIGALLTFPQSVSIFPLMQLEWNEIQVDLYGRYRDFGNEYVAPRAQKLAASNAFDHESWDALCQSGFFELILPEEYGGRGAHWWDFTAAMEGLASGCGDGGFLLSAISQAGFIRGLSTLGTPAQKEKYFPRLLKGELTATAIAEPQSGSDLSSLGTTASSQNAIASSQGADWLLNGSKWNISHAPTATVYLVVGRIPDLGKRDLTLFLVDRGSPGFSSGPPEEKLGNRTLPTSWLKFEDVSLSNDNVLGEPGNGLKALASIVTLQRIYYGWMTSRLLLPVLDDAIAFLEQRKSFKQPLLKHQHVQRKITDILLGLEQSRWSGIGAMHQMLSGSGTAAMQSSIAKLTGARACVEGAQDLLTLMGSNGYQTSKASYLVQDALGFLTVGGTEEMHRINIFNQFMRNR